LRKYAVDTNVFLNVFKREEPFLGASLKLFRAANQKRVQLIISEVVLTELLVGVFLSPQPRIFRRKLERFLTAAQVQTIPNTAQALDEAGRAFSEFFRKRGAMFQCPRCGKVISFTCPSCEASIYPRERMLPDFLVGAHAIVNAEGLITRERPVYEAYFPSLKLLSPEEALSQLK